MMKTITETRNRTRMMSRSLRMIKRRMVVPGLELR
jgi:hypothetical protein